MTKATMTITLKCGRSYVIHADSAKLRRLKIALARRMHTGERVTENVHGDVFEGGEAHPVDVTVTTDQIAGVQLVFPASTARESGTADERAAGAAGE